MSAGPQGLRPEWTVGEVLRAGLPDFAREHRLPAHHWKTLNALAACRTPMLGGCSYRCENCGEDHFVPYSCGNRHCANCQARDSLDWLERQQGALLPVPYFHLVFTLPHRLNGLIGQNQKTLYDLLFRSVSDTLLEFGRNNLGATIGISAVLHTWGQTLPQHYHLHGIVTGGGISLDGNRWVHSKPDYLFPVQALSAVFRGKFRDGLKSLFVGGKLQFHGKMEPMANAQNFQELVRQACQDKWVVYSKAPFAGPEQVLRYLSTYTHRVGISNRRIKELDRQNKTVTFTYRDYADNGQKKTMTLEISEFIRRFCLHILPQGFVKIRHFGLMANGQRRARIAQARELLGQQTAPQTTTVAAVFLALLASGQEGSKPGVCPRCGKPALVLLRVDPRRRATPAPVIQDSS